MASETLLEWMKCTTACHRHINDGQWFWIVWCSWDVWCTMRRVGVLGLIPGVHHMKLLGLVKSAHALVKWTYVMINRMISMPRLCFFKPNQLDKRSRSTLWSVISKAADRSNKQWPVIFWWLMACVKWSCSKTVLFPWNEIAYRQTDVD